MRWFYAISLVTLVTSINNWYDTCSSFPGPDKQHWTNFGHVTLTEKKLYAHF
ncbi:hypothetical protein PR003_g33415 [Phytophthora rubi]|uniref:Uncharacterized protein n=1 Tax=Phytophthora rubi TaxID=129364 RepID=A0A6A3GC22_9STRA|nr:hypothetical protein PR001_g32442 [Phytophthora rubi]KAE8954613.1 hypothetical protein PR002_g32032 [Phytophthora rubi]KAE9262778.1 hypothetical protein PR003_g33415 [Phytophthora rubi]